MPFHTAEAAASSVIGSIVHFIRAGRAYTLFTFIFSNDYLGDNVVLIKKCVMCHQAPLFEVQ
jgi:hypothetical protein